jgi:hypothetical protein
MADVLGPVDGRFSWVASLSTSRGLTVHRMSFFFSSAIVGISFFLISAIVRPADFQDARMIVAFLFKRFQFFDELPWKNLTLTYLTYAFSVESW